MSFIRGMWRLLGANDADEESEQKIVEYPTSISDGGSQPESLPARMELSMPDESMICVTRPELDAKGQPDYSLKQYAAFLLNRQPLLLDLTEISAANADEAASVLHYLSGVVEAVDGSVWEIHSGIYLFTPSNVALAGDPLRQVEVR
jgi:FtsZ-interacting cell division protein YlmF